MFRVPDGRRQARSGERLVAYYAPVAGQVGYIWTVFDAIKQIRRTSLWNDRVRPYGEFLEDAAGTLPAVSWLIPDWAVSDHPTRPIPGGPPTVSVCEGENWTVQYHQRHHAGAELADDGDRAGVG